MTRLRRVAAVLAFLAPFLLAQTIIPGPGSSGGGGSGTVTSVSVGPGLISSTGGPITTSGTITQGIVQCQCRLNYVSTTQIRLDRKDGQYVFINGTTYSIPSAGVTLAATGLTVGTTYYVYVYDSGGGTLALTASATAYAASTYGYQQITGNGAYHLVGMAYISTGPAFADSSAQRFVASYYNRRGRTITSAIAGNYNSSTTAIEISSTGRTSFLSWADEDVDIFVGGYATNSVGTGIVNAAVAVDSTTAVTGSTAQDQNSSTAGTSGALAARGITNVSEGTSHYATILGWQNFGTATFYLTLVGRVRI